MLNKMAHCSSYEEVEIINTCLAKEIIAKSEETGVTIPSNIFLGNFVQMAADNNEINEETIDGFRKEFKTYLFRQFLESGSLLL